MDSTQIWVSIIAGVLSVLGGIGAAIKTCGAFLAPRIDNSFKRWDGFIDKLGGQHDTLEKLVCANDTLATMLQAERHAGLKRQSIILLVEDNELDRKMIAQHIVQMMAEVQAFKSLSYRSVSRLTEVYEYLPFCKLVVIDVNLPDATNQTVIDFVDSCTHCVVVVFSGTDQSPKDFQKAYAIINKSEGPKRLREVIKEALLTKD